MHRAGGAQLAAVGLAAVSIGDRGGPGWRITGIKRVRRLAELLGEPPIDAGRGLAWLTAATAFWVDGPKSGAASAAQDQIGPSNRLRQRSGPGILARISRPRGSSCAEEVVMSQPVLPGTPGPTIGAAITTDVTVTAGPSAPTDATVRPTPRAPTVTTSPRAPTVTTEHGDRERHRSPRTADRPVGSTRRCAPGKSRSARIRQISVLGVFTSVAMVSVRVPAVVIVPVMIVVLAGIDIVGGIVAKSWALGRSPWAFAAGVALFVLLFWVYGMSLRHGELSTITIGWVVLVTLADMGLDRFHYDVHFPLSKWIAALAAVALLAYLLVGTDEPDGSPADSTSCEHRPPPQHRPAPATPRSPSRHSPATARSPPRPARELDSGAR